MWNGNLVGPCLKGCTELLEEQSCITWEPFLVIYSIPLLQGKDQGHMENKVCMGECREPIKACVGPAGECSEHQAPHEACTHFSTYVQ